MSNMASVTPIYDPASDRRRARAAFVKSLLEDDDRSARYVAGKIGISNTALGDRLKGRVPFLADELEPIARVLKRDPVAFYAEYLAVGPEGFEPPTSTVESRRLATVTPIRRNAA